MFGPPSRSNNCHSRRIQINPRLETAGGFLLPKIQGYGSCLDMRYITNLLAVILITSFSFAPIVRAEDVIVVEPVIEASVTAAALSATISSPDNNSTIQPNVATTFTAASSGGEPPYAYTWDFGDGTTAFGQSYSKTFTSIGAKTVTLKITDFAGHTDEASISVTVASPIANLMALITSPEDNKTFQTGVAITFSTSVTGGEPPYAYTWDFGDGTTAIGQTYEKTYTSAGAKTASLVVTDFAGHRTVNSVSLTITSPVTPPGPDADTTAPTQPTIVSSTINANATSTSGALTISWTPSTDPTVSGQTNSGLAGYSYIVDHNPITAPDATIETTSTSLTQTLGNGTWWLHLIAKDNAGNSSSPVTHYGPMGVATSSTTLDPLTISNIRVTDLTYNSAIVRWTTNRGATSRVIYDTTSHPSISGQTAPNFGYASSTATADVDTKVIEHVVSVTGLSPSTSYYFRVLSQ